MLVIILSIPKCLSDQPTHELPMKAALIGTPRPPNVGPYWTVKNVGVSDKSLRPHHAYDMESLRGTASLAALHRAFQYTAIIIPIYSQPIVAVDRSTSSLFFPTHILEGARRPADCVLIMMFQS